VSADGAHPPLRHNPRHNPPIRPPERDSTPKTTAPRTNTTTPKRTLPQPLPTRPPPTTRAGAGEPSPPRGAPHGPNCGIRASHALTLIFLRDGCLVETRPYHIAPVVTLCVMAGSVSCRVEQLSSAKPEVVYDVLMDVERWPDWMPTVSTASWERKGALDTGQGGIRRVRSGITVAHDRIVDGSRPHHHAYTASLPRFWPLKDFRGDVRLEDHPEGCLIIWTVTCTSRIPGLRKSVQSTVDQTYTRIAAALAQEAEHTRLRIESWSSRQRREKCCGSWMLS
jgi:hypothetical protein